MLSLVPSSPEFFSFSYSSHNMLLEMDIRFTDSYGILSMKSCTYFDPQICMILPVITIVNLARNVKKLICNHFFLLLGGGYKVQGILEEKIDPGNSKLGKILRLESQVS